jgi:predicted HTH domain antitoxin
MNTAIEIELPDDIARLLESRWGDLPRRAREAIAIEAYRSGALSQAQVQQMLQLQSRWEVDALLKKAGVYLDYSEDDLERELRLGRQVRHV